MLEKLSVCTATRRTPDQNGHQQQRPGSARRAEGGGYSATGERTDPTPPGLGVNPGPVCLDEEAGPARAPLVPLPPATPLLASASVITCCLLCPRFSSRQTPGCWSIHSATHPGSGTAAAPGLPLESDTPQGPGRPAQEPLGVMGQVFLSLSLPISEMGVSVFPSVPEEPATC